MSLILTGVILFIQSRPFANLVKKNVTRYLPTDLGIDGDFSEFAIALFPPGVSLRNPTLAIHKDNIANLPSGSTLSAKRLDLIFQPLQILSGKIRIHEVAVINGDVFLNLTPEKKKEPKKKKKLRPTWEDLFQIKIESATLKDTRIRVVNTENKFDLKLTAHALRVSQKTSNPLRDNTQSSNGPGPYLGYEAIFDTQDIQGFLPGLGEFPGAEKSIDRLIGHAVIAPQSVTLQELAVTHDGLKAKGSGFISGNILDPGTDLKYEAKLTLTGTIEKLLVYAPSSAAHGHRLKDLSGDLTFNGTTSGKIFDFTKTFQAEGNIQIQTPRYNAWSADHLELDVHWSPSQKGGNIDIKRAIIRAAEKPRIGGTQAGYGGRIECGAFQVSPSNLDRITIPINLSNAHIHWLAAPELDSLFATDFRVSGDAEVILAGLTSKQSWTATVKTNLAIDHLILDNQRLGKSKPRHTVLDIAEKLKLSGTLIVDASGISPQQMNLDSTLSRFIVDGKVDFRKGYQLIASGQVDFKDIRTIAEIPITGQGKLTAHIQGPTSDVRIHFDGDLKNTSYLRLKLGDLAGRITWEDKTERVLFNQIRLAQGATAYLGNGMIDVGSGQWIDLSFQIAQGQVQDLMRVMEAFTHDIWWFPSTLNGSTTGTIAITGGLSMDKLQVLARANGYNWEYLGERFKNVIFTGGYDRGKYYLSEFHGIKKSGRLSGKVSFNAEKDFAWNLKSDRLSLTDFDLFAKLDVPMRGSVTIDSSGRGRGGAIKSETSLRLANFSIRGNPMLPSQLVIETANSVLKTQGTALGGSGVLDLKYDFKPGGASYIKTQMRKLDYSPILFLLNSNLSQDPELSAFISGGLNITFPSDSPDRGSGTLDIREYSLKKSGTNFRLLKPMSIKIDEGSFAIKDLGIKGNLGDAYLNLTSAATKLDGTLSGALDIGVTEFFTSTIASAAGTADLDFKVSGLLKSPLLTGKSTLNNGTLRLAAIDTPLENITGNFQLRQNIVTLNDFNADLASGRVSAKGTVELFANRYPKLNLNAVLYGPKLKIFPFQFIKVNGPLSVTGDKIPYLIQGNITSDSALLKEKVLQQKQAGGLKTALYLPETTGQGDSALPKFKLDIKATSDKGLLVQNDLFDAELKGRVTIINTPIAPRILGTADLIQGKLFFKNQAFQIQNANATFDNPTIINPQFTLIATTEVNAIKVQLYASGRLSNWKAEFTSNPVLAESEILSLLTMGVSPTETRKAGGTDRSVVEQGEAASLLLHSLDFNREVQSKTGFQIQLGESVDAQSGANTLRPQSAAENAAVPKIVIKRQIGKNLDLSLGSTVGVGTGSRKEVNAEYRLNPNLSVIGVWDNYETPDVQERKSFGLDLKWQKRFK